ncbi:hypothetical protein Cycma_4837 [Cyclobacterium marinum DSM 745]|uniref:Peptide methionine sulfoxide reductase n=1 Tax=Cyclobacterium marinum (strain ATCC 25205 / DSM 745 / LMG 13164 / NCIMB 1802) TaxID=880070 RepID=G0J6K7_CYCMS|nr:hypothetical protein Cycma_4837 [Cyclobacterium marinum DSM 745]
MLLDRIYKLPIGYSEVIYENKKYGLTRADFNRGNSIKIYARELGGKNFISLNYYITNKQDLLKPCEMSDKKVIHFLKNLMILE